MMKGDGLKLVKEIILDYFIFNGKLYKASNDKIFNEITSPSVYEVIRVIDGVPLYVEEHLERMRKSVQLIGYEIDKKDDEIVSEIIELIKVNNYPNLNVKVLCSNLDKDKQIFLVYFIESFYPEKKMYDNGVRTILYHSERENPNAKVVNIDLRERVNKVIKSENAYEALLVNKKGYITEGSKSNVFFVKGNQVYTAPGGEVLLGVTRNRIVSICRKMDINLIEEHIHINTLCKFDGAFLTGTSINVLPITTIKDIKYDSVNNLLVRKIIESYLKDVDEYITYNKKEIQKKYSINN
jgi:branched-chain amino acid aminotransferase